MRLSGISPIHASQRLSQAMIRGRPMRGSHMKSNSATSAKLSGASNTARSRDEARFFFGLLRECLDQGIVTEDMLREEMRQNHVRHDAFEVLDRTSPLAA